MLSGCEANLIPGHRLTAVIRCSRPVLDSAILLVIVGSLLAALACTVVVDDCPISLALRRTERKVV